MSNSIESCMRIEGTGEALTCIKEMIANSTDKCRPKLVLLVSEGCDYCREEEQNHKADIDAGIIQKLDISSREGIDMVQKNDLDAVPALILFDCHNNILMK